MIKQAQTQKKEQTTFLFTVKWNLKFEMDADVTHLVWASSETNGRSEQI